MDRDLLGGAGANTARGATAGGSSTSSSDGSSISKGAIAAIVISSVVAALLLAFAVLLVVRERRGRPMFGQPLLSTSGSHQAYSAELSPVPGSVKVNMTTNNGLKEPIM